jgi:hypothetical protein
MRKVLFILIIRSAVSFTGLVLRYLESMCKDGEEPNRTPPRSLIDAEEYRNLIASPRSGHYTPVGDQDSRPGRAHVEAERADDDADSNVQQGERSENGDPPVCQLPTLLQNDVMTDHVAA